MQDNSYTHLTFIFLLLLVIVNLFLLDLKIFSPASSIKLADIRTVATPIPSVIPTTGINNDYLSCPASCLSVIDAATKSSAFSIGSSLQDKITSSQQTVQPTTQREVYIPLGNGSTQKTDWEDAIATETIIDTTNYGQIKEAYFIASLRNPTQNGQAEAQLFNVTDKHPAWGSHVIMHGPLSQTITSAKITLASGNKLYRVQLKSSLSFPVYLDSAKIKIITQ
ncbi:hypothetical protein FJY90_03755 [Candidatus Gottesmanbacteria bacterium]|nr:hypothetical protein [Candidatus Gottesmanbacteria bacterium]